MNTETWILRRRWWERVGLLLPVALLSLCLGCGGGGKDLTNLDKGLSEDQKAVSDLVGTVADYAPSLPRLRTLFTSDAAPSEAQRAKLAQYMVGVDGDIVVTGDSATIPVMLTSYDDNTTSLSQQWKAQKVDGAWKLADTPVP